MKRWTWPPILILLASSAISIAVALISGQLSGGPLIAICLVAMLPLAAIPFLRRDETEESAELARARADLKSERDQFDQEKDDLENWRADLASQLDDQVTRIEARERALIEKFAAHQELYELPAPSVEPADLAASREARLAENDRLVLEILQEEAERVFEKIRANGYVTEGKADVGEIRDDILALITRVARVYSPGSDRPLLETSFEQVARAAGRVCLHMLVLVEQLPMDVKQYNFHSLYSYVQKAVVAYGHYKTATPWLTYLSRGIHAGRLVAGANPVSLGAWVLATEVGKRAGAKAIERYVNQQAIGLLHDFIRVIGVEVANVYGGDFRHRDPNWIYGAELTELMGRFPISRESLREGLRQISTLQLRNEYDRIYLYRCLADHRSAGFRCADPAVLTRAEREYIATRLEAFYADFIHGTVDEDVDRWAEDFESRFDMKLKLTAAKAAGSDEVRKQECVQSISSFLRHVLGLDHERTETGLQACEIATEAASPSESDTPGQFQPPNLDPSDPLVDEYLRNLVDVVGRIITPDDAIEGLLVETAAYFRRPAHDVVTQLEAVFTERATAGFDKTRWFPAVPPAIARAILLQRNTRATFAYPNLTRVSGESEQHLQDAWLVGFATAPSLRVLQQDGTELWTAETVSCSRQRSLLIDSCQVSGGTWSRPEFEGSSITIPGSVRGGGFARYFSPLLDR